MASPYFTPAIFKYLRDLKDNNDRAWFKANQQRFEQELREPALRFITDFAPHLGRISHSFLADPRRSGGSLFRIYRDTRFSHDKTPYKIHTGIHFRHEMGKNAHTPGFYLHLEPGDCMVGVGLWHPDTATLKRIRTFMVEHPDRWRKATTGRAFLSRFVMTGEKLKTYPRGFSPDHPMIEDLRWKDLTAMARYTQKDVVAKGFPEQFAADCRTGACLVKFLCEALDQPF